MKIGKFVLMCGVLVSGADDSLAMHDRTHQRTGVGTQTELTGRMFDGATAAPRTSATSSTGRFMDRPAQDRTALMPTEGAVPDDPSMPDCLRGDKIAAAKIRECLDSGDLKGALESLDLVKLTLSEKNEVCRWIMKKVDPSVPDYVSKYHDPRENAYMSSVHVNLVKGDYSRALSSFVRAVRARSDSGFPGAECIDAVRWFLRKGADPNRWDPSDYYRCLDLLRDVEIARVLVEEGGADVCAPDPYGDLPLHTVAMSGIMYDGRGGAEWNRELIEYLLECYPEAVDVEDGEGRLPVEAFACTFYGAEPRSEIPGDREMLRLLEPSKGKIVRRDRIPMPAMDNPELRNLLSSEGWSIE